VIDSYGRVVKSLGLERAGTVDSALPVAARGRTLFAQFGNIVPGFLVLMMFLAAVVFRRR
jgi:apolipoprotein N-acyltransferase